jgi:hypothetical protein
MTRAAARGQKTNSFNCPGFCAVGSKCGKLETDYSCLWVRLGGGHGLPPTVNSPPVAPLDAS